MYPIYTYTKGFDIFSCSILAIADNLNFLCKNLNKYLLNKITLHSLEVLILPNVHLIILLKIGHFNSNIYKYHQQQVLELLVMKLHVHKFVD